MAADRSMWLGSNLSVFLWLLADLENDLTEAVEPNGGVEGVCVMWGGIENWAAIIKCELEYCFYYDAKQLRRHRDSHQRCLRDG